MARKKNADIVRSSAAEYLTFVSATGAADEGIEVRYEDENVWLTQKLMAQLYGVSLPTINEHLVNIYGDNELSKEATIRKFRIVQTEGSRQVLPEGYRHLCNRHRLRPAGNGYQALLCNCPK